MTNQNRDNQTAQAPEKQGRFHTVLVFLLVLAAVFALVLAAAYRDGTGFDALRRYFHYGGDSAGGETVYRYEASAHNHFASAGESLVVLSDTNLQIVGLDGSEVWSAPVRMSAPTLSEGGGRVAAYDVGGTELHILDAAGELYSFTAEEDEPILSARINKNGYLALTSGKKNYKGSVRVFDQSMEEIFEFKSSRRFVVDACVTEDNSRLAAVTLGQENSVFVSNLVIYRLDQEEPEANRDISGTLVMEIASRGQSLVTAGDTCFSWTKNDGAPVAEWSYSGEYLREYDLNGDGFAAALLNRHQSGSVGRLVTVDSSGTVLGSLDVREEVLNISAAGRYLAVLYASRLVVYTPALQVYSSLSGADDLRWALMRSDGSVLLLGSASASIFLP